MKTFLKINRAFVAKLFFFFAAALILCACHKNPKAINSTELQGKYEVDLSAFVSQYLEGEDDMVKAVAAFMLSSMHMTLTFEKENLIVDASESMRGIINSFGDSDQMPFIVEYRIVNDSLLSTREKDGEWKDAGVLRKMSESYDYLQWIPDVNDDDVLTLRRVE